MRNRAVIVLLAVASLAGSGVAPADAHIVYKESRVYDGHSNDIPICIHARSEVSHGSTNQGYQKGTLVGLVDGIDFAPYCGDWDNERQKAMYQWLYSWDGVGGHGWKLCTSWGWHYTYDRILEKGYTYPTVPCGNQYYGTYTRVCVYAANLWRCGNRWSGDNGTTNGWHWLPVVQQVPSPTPGPGVIPPVPPAPTLEPINPPQPIPIPGPPAPVPAA